MSYLKIYDDRELVTPNPLNFSEQEVHLFKDQFEKVIYSPNELLTKPGEIENYLYFLVEGSLKVLAFQNDVPICIDFASSGTMFCSFASFLSRQPSRVAVQSLSRLIAYRVHYDSIYKLDQLSPNTHYFSKQLTKSFYNELFDNRLLFAGLNARERYERLLAHRPDWIYQIPIKDLASYLGIHPESLSRLRREMYHTDRG